MEQFQYDILMIISGGYRGGGVVGVITPPPLVAENFVCSNSNFSLTGAITPDHTPPPCGHHPPPPSENPVSAPDNDTPVLKSVGLTCTALSR